MFLIVYVDDFKLSGPKANLKEGWNLIRHGPNGNKGIDIDDPVSLESEAGENFLGCRHRIVTPPKGVDHDNLPVLSTWFRVMPDGTGNTIFQSKSQKKEDRESNEGPEEYYQKKLSECIYMGYDMEDFWEACVNRYLEFAPPGTKLKNVATPFIDESIRLPLDFGAPAGPEREAAKRQQQKDIDGGSTLADSASKVLMKDLYGARCCRFDLLRPICALASKVTKWDRLCDAKLHRLKCMGKSATFRKPSALHYSQTQTLPADLRQ